MIKGNEKEETKAKATTTDPYVNNVMLTRMKEGQEKAIAAMRMDIEKVMHTIFQWGD
jgi:hypothetical protein